MRKRTVTLLLAINIFTISLFGCGNSEQQAGKEKEGSVKSEDLNGQDNNSDDELSEIVVGWMSFSSMDNSQTDVVEEKINEITETEINTHVDIQWYDPNTYATQIPMMIQANEKLDLVMYTPVPGTGFMSFLSQKQLLEIGGLIEEYAADLPDILGDLLNGTTTPEGIFGVPT